MTEVEKRMAETETIQEAMLDQLTLGCEAEALADQVAESLAEVLGYGDDPRGDLAEGLAHMGIGPDDIESGVREVIRGLAWRAATTLTGQPIPEKTPTGAAGALAKVRRLAREMQAAA